MPVLCAERLIVYWTPDTPLGQRGALPFSLGADRMLGGEEERPLASPRDHHVRRRVGRVGTRQMSVQK